MLAKIIVAKLSVLVVAIGFSAVAAAQNSTVKKRVALNATAAKIGTAVNWQTDFESAQALSVKTKRPIFWYVPTVPGSFMDRKSSIDRYMLAGPFSWPSLIEIINQNFVPLKAVPTQIQQKKFGLLPYQFIEPGFVIVNSESNVVHAMNRLTTLHLPWLESVIKKAVPISTKTERSRNLQAMWDQFTAGEFANIGPLPVLEQEQPEHDMIRAMAMFRMGQHQRAKDQFKIISQDYPEHPLGFKAAAEMQGVGPFVRGFEVFNRLPKLALTSNATSQIRLMAPPVYSDQQLCRRSADFLIGMQHQNGGFFDCDYDFGGTDSLPNVHSAITSLCGMAMLKIAKSSPDANRKRLEQAVRQAALYVAEDRHHNFHDRDEIFWAMNYRLELWLAIAASQDNGNALIKKSVISAQIPKLIDALENLQTRRGGWYHEYTNPFVTATGLLALSEAKKSGHRIKMDKFERGIHVLAQSRSVNGAFPYALGTDGAAPRSATIEASAGRMPLCEAALVAAEKSDQANLNQSLLHAFRFQKHLDAAYKYDDHTSNLAYGGFFFWYDLRGRKQAIELIADKKKRLTFSRQLNEIIRGVVEVDGCFVDSHELGRCYGTAMAMLCLDLGEPTSD